MKCLLSDIAEITMGQSPKSEYYNTKGDGIPFLQGNRTFGKKYPIFDIYTSFVTKMAKAGDIIMSVRAPVGDLNITPIDICLGRGVCGIRMKNGNQDFLFYLLKYYIPYLLNKESGTIFGSVNKKDISNLEIIIPENVKIQQKISSILSIIDKKIEENEKINKNLEEQAQSYFQELFIDDANLERTTGTISDLGTVVGGSTPSKAKSEYYAESAIAWITPKDLAINKSKFVSHGENDITELGLKNSSAVIMPEGTVLFSSRAPIGYIAIATGEVTTNQGFKSVVPKPKIGTPFVYFFLKNALPIIEGMASGSTFKEVSGSTMKNVPAVIPDIETLARFNDFCTPIFAQQRILEEQNQSLATLRDNLLPKLMYGEFDISALDI